MSTFTIPGARSFVAALAVASKALNTYTTVPIIACVLLEYNGKGRLRATITDLETTVAFIVPAQSDSEPFSAVIDAKRFLTFLKTAKTEIACEVVEGGASLSVVHGTSHAKFVTLPAEEFPQVRRATSYGSDECTASFTSDFVKAREVIATASTFTSTEEARGAILMGVHLDMASKRVTATDGYGMFTDDTPFIRESGEKESMIVPASTLAILKALKAPKTITGAKAPKLRIEIVKGNCIAAFTVRLDDVSYFIGTRLVDGTYPSVDMVMQSNPASFFVSINRSAMIDVLKGIGRPSKHERKTVVLSLLGNKSRIAIQSKSDESAYEAEIEMEPEDSAPAAFKIGFNPTLLATAFNAFAESHVKLGFSGVETPGWITSGTRTVLAMPFRGVVKAEQEDAPEDGHQETDESEASAA